MGMLGFGIRVTVRRVVLALAAAAALVTFASAAGAGQALPAPRAVAYDVTVRGSFSSTAHVASSDGQGACKNWIVIDSRLDADFVSRPGRNRLRVWFVGRKLQHERLYEPFRHGFEVTLKGEAREVKYRRRGCRDETKEESVKHCNAARQPANGYLGFAPHPRSARPVYRMDTGPYVESKCRAFIIIGPNAYSKYFNAQLLFSKARFTLRGRGRARYRDRDGTVTAHGRWIAHFCRRPTPRTKPRPCGV